MKSVKPGRGPSAMGAMGSVIAVIFGIFWTIAAASMGAPGIFPLFGVHHPVRERSGCGEPEKPLFLLRHRGGRRGTGPPGPAVR